MKEYPLDFGDAVPCEWTYDDYHYKWDTSCGEAFQFTNDGPIENGFLFCPYCSCGIALETRKPESGISTPDEDSAPEEATDEPEYVVAEADDRHAGYYIAEGDET